MNTHSFNNDDADAADAYDKPRPSDWDTLEDAQAAAQESPALKKGAILISWDRKVADNFTITRFGWRSTDLGMDLPKGAKVLKRYINGQWQPEVD